MQISNIFFFIHKKSNLKDVKCSWSRKNCCHPGNKLNFSLESSEERQSTRTQTRIGAIPNNVHGITTYVRDTLADWFLTHSEYLNNIHVIAVEVSGVTVVNVYNHPSSNWSSNTLKVFPHPTISVCDFYSHSYVAMSTTTQMVSFIRPDGGKIILQTFQL
jgi:hypothetical protein